MSTTAIIVALFAGLIACEEHAYATGRIGQQDAQVCIAIYENLKIEVADGDYVKYRIWRSENEEVLREFIESEKARAETF